MRGAISQTHCNQLVLQQLLLSKLKSETEQLLNLPSINSVEKNGCGKYFKRSGGIIQSSLQFFLKAG